VYGLFRGRDVARHSRFADNRRMPKKALPAQSAEEIHILVEDAADLTPKELELERRALVEEIRKRSWMTEGAQQLASRIPVSVFAMGDMA
jgi:hypothetical protein